MGVFFVGGEVVLNLLKKRPSQIILRFFLVGSATQVCSLHKDVTRVFNAMSLTSCSTEEMETQSVSDRFCKSEGEWMLTSRGGQLSIENS